MRQASLLALSRLILERHSAMDARKTLRKVLAGSRNIRFGEVVRLAEAFGFRLARVSGSHHIFAHPALPELLNLQEVDGKAKPYQVRQLVRLSERYNLGLKDSG